MERYLDLDLIINGGMDTLLLCLSARLLNLPVRFRQLFAAVLIGEIPVVISAFCPESVTLLIAKVLIPFLMTGVLFSARNMRLYFKATLLFWILSAGLGGLIYALWGWLYFEGEVYAFRIGLKNFWYLPLGAILWWIGQRAWAGWTKAATDLKPLLCDLVIDFGKRGEPVLVRALIDTGNQLRDPMTGSPVIILEGRCARSGIPEDVLPVLDSPWRGMNDPWNWLWQQDPEWIKRLVFIPYQAVGHKSWLLGIRPQRILCVHGNENKELKATVALVQEVLSPDSTYQALMYSEREERVEGH